MRYKPGPNSIISDPQDFRLNNCHNTWGTCGEDTSKEKYKNITGSRK